MPSFRGEWYKDEERNQHLRRFRLPGSSFLEARIFSFSPTTMLLGASPVEQCCLGILCYGGGLTLLCDKVHRGTGKLHDDALNIFNGKNKLQWLKCIQHFTVYTA